jgi:hypothetical protein
MWSCPHNEMIEAVLLHASTAIRRRTFACARIRAGSRFKRFLCFVLIAERCFRVPLRCSRIPPGVLVPQIEDHYPRIPLLNKLLATSCITAVALGWDIRAAIAMGGIKWMGGFISISIGCLGVKSRHQTPI